MSAIDFRESRPAAAGQYEESEAAYLAMLFQIADEADCVVEWDQFTTAETEDPVRFIALVIPKQERKTLIDAANGENRHIFENLKHLDQMIGFTRDDDFQPRDGLEWETFVTHHNFRRGNSLVTAIEASMDAHFGINQAA